MLVMALLLRTCRPFMTGIVSDQLLAKTRGTICLPGGWAYDGLFRTALHHLGDV